MSDAIITSAISALASILTGGLTLVGVVVSNSKSKKALQHRLEIGQAVTDEKITELTREVREHNGFARRLPVVEEQVKVINHRISDLEDYHRP